MISFEGQTDFSLDNYEIERQKTKNFGQIKRLNDFVKKNSSLSLGPLDFNFKHKINSTNPYQIAHKTCTENTKIPIKYLQSGEIRKILYSAKSDAEVVQITRFIFNNRKLKWELKLITFSYACPYL